MQKGSTRKFWQQGEPFVWLTAAAQTLVLIAVFGLGFVILLNGVFVFWPGSVKEFHMTNNTKVIGEVVKSEEGPQGLRSLIKIGNRELVPQDFVWINDRDVSKTYLPEETVVLERLEDGNFYGYFESFQHPQKGQLNSWDEFISQLERVSDERDAIHKEFIKLGKISDRIEDIRIELKSHEATSEKGQRLLQKRAEFKKEYDTRQAELDKNWQELDRHAAVFKTSEESSYEIPLAHIVRAWKPNQMTLREKILFYCEKIIELFLDEPRESNTEGGLFPAIIGTVMLVFLMSLVAFPMGLVAGIYLAEYAKEGNLLRLVRIAVNNLAGIPSIVYGIFGLGFFIYGVGSTIDQFFFADRLPQPTFGTGGILWASLTLSILTVPVVIVATEEALRTVPGSLKNGSLALGATRFQTLVKVLVPAAAPGILTGFILAMARAAGEVAPLMLTGVVKLAPSLPLDGEFPFLHLDRKFMHLGFHIYDVGFQSPNAEAARPMVFVTTLLLVGIVLMMNLTAMRFRQKLRNRLTIKSF